MTRRWLLWVAFEWTLILAALAIGLHWPLLWPIVVLFIGTRQHALAVLGHEAVHYAVHGDKHLSRRINDGLGNTLCMWPLMTDVAGFRRFHLLHHQFVGTDMDPEKRVREPFIERWTDLTPAKKARLFAMDLVGLSLDEALAILRETRGRWTWTRGLYLVGLAGVALAFLGWPAVVAWGVALVTSAFASMRLRMFREHLGSQQVTETYTARWWERALYLPHYIWMHERHHRLGCWSVPAWELRNLPA